jgi:hypothetical protein
MLQKLILKNFQAHKHSEIEFSPDVTCITGLNNHGKSSIFRALQKCIRDIPEGNSFIMNTPFQEDTCTITVVSDKGEVIRQVKRNIASDANFYKVSRIDGTEEEYVKFGKTGIPEEVTNNFPTSPPQMFGDVEIDMNFHNQLDSLFLIQGAGLSSLRGKVLGKTTGVDKVQRAIQISSSEEKKEKQILKILKQQSEDVAVKLLEYKDIDTFLKLLVSCENLFQETEEKRILITNIIGCYEILKNIVTKAKQLKITIKVIDIDSLKEFFQKITQTYNVYNLANRLLTTKEQITYSHQVLEITKVVPTEDYQVLQKKLSLLKKLKDLYSIQIRYNDTKLKVAYINSLLPSLESNNYHIIQSLSKYNSLFTIQDTLFLLKKRIIDKQQIISNKINELSSTELELTNFKKEIKVCPTCGKAW